ncbi:hypothetical protein [Helicobacter bilis]|uniref:hypothetical protein n=1 Tax=Helicobacter bilis TaxID=37372 RepID=UPI0025A93D1F|nr:hypothetical protein [Helicobacter bilis]
MFNIRGFMDGLYFSAQDELEYYLRQCENKKEIENIVMKELQNYLDIAEIEITTKLDELKETK